jgi:hypothetical protein
MSEPIIENMNDQLSSEIVPAAIYADIDVFRDRRGSVVLALGSILEQNGKLLALRQGDRPDGSPTLIGNEVRINRFLDLFSIGETIKSLVSGPSDAFTDYTGYRYARTEAQGAEDEKVVTLPTSDYLNEALRRVYALEEDGPPLLFEEEAGPVSDTRFISGLAEGKVVVPSVEQPEAFKQEFVARSLGYGRLNRSVATLAIEKARELKAAGLLEETERPAYNIAERSYKYTSVEPMLFRAFLDKIAGILNNYPHGSQAQTNLLRKNIYDLVWRTENKLWYGSRGRKLYKSLVSHQDWLADRSKAASQIY